MCQQRKIVVVLIAAISESLFCEPPSPKKVHFFAFVAQATKPQTDIGNALSQSLLNFFCRALLPSSSSSEGKKVFVRFAFSAFA